MFPQRNRGFQQPMPYSQNYNKMNYPNMMGYPQPQPPQGGGLFGRPRPRFGGYPAYPNQLPNQYYQQPQPQPYNPQQMPLYQQYQYQQPPQQQQNQSIFHDKNGKIDFNKISGGVQSAIGIVNQVSPMMKTLGGLFTK